MRRLDHLIARGLVAVVLTTVGLVLCQPHPTPARASCVPGVFVDGLFEEMLFNTGGYEVPPADGTVEVVFPGCNDTGYLLEPDRLGQATRLKGVPPTVAVQVDSRLYVAQGQMTALAGHPLHRRMRKRSRNCRRGPTVLRYGVPGPGSVQLGRGRGMITIDARTHLTNASVTTPVMDGQRFRVRTSYCGRRRFADRLTFLSPVLQPKRYQPVFVIPPRPPGTVGSG